MSNFHQNYPSYSSQEQQFQALPHMPGGEKVYPKKQKHLLRLNLRELFENMLYCSCIVIGLLGIIGGWYFILLPDTFIPFVAIMGFGSGGLFFSVGIWNLPIKTFMKLFTLGAVLFINSVIVLSFAEHHESLSSLGMVLFFTAIILCIAGFGYVRTNK